MSKIKVCKLNAIEKERLYAILNSWHKIEFFIPFALDKNVVENTTDWKRINWLSKSKLLRGDSLFKFPKIKDGNSANYYLFLGIFDKSEISSVCNEAIGYPEDDNTCHENMERADLEGCTCFAKIQLSEECNPLFDEVSISTLPWALGVVRKHGLSGLTDENFEKAKTSLVRDIQNFANSRSGDGLGSAAPLMGHEVVSLNELFCKWANFYPENAEHIALLQRVESKIKTKATTTATATTTTQNKVDDKEEEFHEPEIDILNSFFIKDIERAKREVCNGYISRSLYHYLTKCTPESRVDLYSEDGKKAILTGMHPSKMNFGRWFDDPDHYMSLMQQFAINKTFEANEKQGIYSVNGPPGTGKTTLLRDIISENIVRRACILASFHSAADAFESSSVRIPIDKNVFSVKKLKPELTGFEMVVASSNNAAVNNISNELPKQSALSEYWRPQSYLRKTARKIGAQTNSGGINSLSDEDERWGLIACALGNKSNRYNFAQKISFYPDGKEKKCNDLELLTIKDSLSSYQGPTFCEAKKDFNAILSIVEKEIADRGDYADLLNELCGQTLQLFTEVETSQVSKAEKSLDCIQSEMISLKHKNSILAKQKAQVLRQIGEHLQNKPGIFARIFRTEKARLHKLEGLAFVSEKKSITSEIDSNNVSIKRLEPQHKQAESFVQKAKNNLIIKRKLWDAKQKEIDSKQSQYANLAIPKTAADLEDKNFQLKGLWGDPSLAVLRTKLFQAALSLHEAWLSEVGKNKSCGGCGFGGNIYAISCYLRQLPKLESEHALILWQSLFMVIPVISTTFAALANQFKGIGQESLGWLLIDEAGQAVPQAAVGALWRAKNAVLVGDPLQIEPVFTVPVQLINSISSLSEFTRCGSYSPQNVSAQNLADACNRYGAYVAGNNPDEQIWIGSPLRVHRRCIDPMFTVSNEIAYENRMIFGLNNRFSPDKYPVKMKSSWVDIAGMTSGLQVVSQQIDFVCQLIASTYGKQGKLPFLYVITPFKSVKYAINEQLLKMDWTVLGASEQPQRSKIRKWCLERVGTVHTFQGKEEDCVIFVLGADSNSRIGAARWASSKPNLLNVAITRAKRRCFIIGDRKLWAGMPNFSFASTMFETVSSEDVFNRIN